MTAHDDYEAFALGLSPVGYWDFAGVGAAALVDRTGNGHNLTATAAPTVNNAVPNLDGFKYALLNGTSQFFTPASGAALNPATFTFCALCWPQAGDGYLWSSEAVAALNTTGWSFFVADAANNQALGMRLDTNASNKVTLDNKTFGAYGGQFILVAVTYDGISQTLWINGAAIGSTLNQSYAPGALTPLIGKAFFTGKFFKGGISDLALYSGVLTSTQLAQFGQKAQLATPATGAQVLDAISVVNSLVTTLTTSLNRIVPPIVSALTVLSTTSVSGIGFLSLAGARGMIVTAAAVPAEWGILFGVVGRYEPRLVQLQVQAQLFGGVTSVSLELVDQYEAAALYLFNDNVPTGLNYDVTVGATVTIQLLH